MTNSERQKLMMERLGFSAVPMSKRLKKLEEENAALKEQLDELKALVETKKD